MPLLLEEARQVVGSDHDPAPLPPPVRGQALGYPSTDGGRMHPRQGGGLDQRQIGRVRKQAVE